MGIRGAAVATVAGYLLSMILAFALLLGKKQKVQIKIKGFHLQKWLIGRIFALGLPSFIINALSSFMVTFVNFFWSPIPIRQSLSSVRILRYSS